MATTHGTSTDERGQAVLLDHPDFLQTVVERTLQQVLEAEMTAHLGAEPYERTETRTGHRNGYKPRTVHTRVGTLTLMVPQDREGTFSTSLFARYQRSEKALVLALMEMYLEGVSTRKVQDITEALCGTTFSKSQVSQLVSTLDGELTAWRTRRLDEQHYPYLMVDARYEDVRCDGRIVSQGVLIVAGVRADGKREIVSVEVADTESEASYQECFRQLKARGLSGVELVTSDDHRGWSCPGSVESLRLGDRGDNRSEQTSFRAGNGAWICGRLDRSDVIVEGGPSTYPHPLLLRRRLRHAATSSVNRRSNAAGER